MKRSPVSTRINKIRNNGKPGPTDYKTDTSKDETLKTSPRIKFGKFTQKCFFDEKAHRKKFIPGTGHYKKLEESIDFAFKPSARGKRY